MSKTNLANATEKIIEELLGNTPEDKRCQNLRVDVRGPYCASGLEKGEQIGEQRRDICDTGSLQLWCLDKYRCNNCLFYHEPPKSSDI